MATPDRSRDGGERRESAQDEAQVPLAAGDLRSRVRPFHATRRRRPRTLIDSLSLPMSMYTRLLDAALEQRPPRGDGAGREEALDEVRRCGAELEVGLPGGDEDTVSAVLARQVGYDVALLELAAVVGIDSGPSRFEQPERERDRLRTALRDLGIRVDAADVHLTERVEADPPRI
jgi:hypothetical protein